MKFIEYLVDNKIPFHFDGVTITVEAVLADSILIEMAEKTGFKITKG